MDLDRSGQRSGNGSRLGVASGNGDDVKQSVGFETMLGADIDLAIGHGLSDEMADGRESVAPIGGLIRGIEQFKRNRVKSEQLTGDGPQNSVARAIGGNRWRMTAAGIAHRRFPRSTEQSPGHRKSHERRS